MNRPQSKGKKCSNNWFHSAMSRLTLCGCTIRTTWPLCVHIFRNGAWAASGGTWGIIELWGRGMMGRWWGGWADCLRQNAARGCWHNWEFWETKRWWFKSKQMYKSINILLMLLCPNFKEEKPIMARKHVLQKVSSQGGEQTSLASKYKLAVHFSYFQINWPSFSEDMQILSALLLYSHCCRLMENNGQKSQSWLKPVFVWVLAHVYQNSCKKKTIYCSD